MKYTVRSEPWLTDGAVEFLRHFIKPDFRVLETGGGASTLWFASRCRVVTYEQDEGWHRIIRSLIGCNANRSTLHLFTPDSIASWDSLYEPKSFDLVLIDTGCHKERRDGLRAGIRLVKPGGVLMADNADAGWVSDIIDELHSLMQGWNYSLSVQCRIDKFGFDPRPNRWTTAWWQSPPAIAEQGILLEGEY